MSVGAILVVVATSTRAAAQSPAPSAPPDPAPADPPPSDPPLTGMKGEEGTPTPLQVDYAQYGVAFAGECLVAPGEIWPSDAAAPCILGPGGGPVLRGAYRPAGPWYIGGAYQFAKLDSNNLYRLGILQELRAEMRYFFDVGSRFTPYATWALGGMIYGNEFGADTGGVTTFAGGGVELEITRFAVLSLNLAYQPMLFFGFDDSAGQERLAGVAHFIHLDLGIELKTELSRE
ncbi:MAG: hypothetical protein HOW73_11455 [Polyangiaceae bacterium]|nr:hypothetical protein [Polyangiaceae bacterium]